MALSRDDLRPTTPAPVQPDPAPNRPPSARKAAANRRNARHSTGPRTEAGKVRSARNALTHGLRARRLTVIPGEDAAEFVAFERQMVQSLRPLGLAQQLLAEQAARVAWKLRVRLPHAEAELWYDATAEARESWAGWAEHEGHDATPIREELPEGLLAPETLADCYAHAGAPRGEGRERAEDGGPGYGNTSSVIALARLERYESILRRELQQVIRSLVALQKHQGMAEEQDEAEFVVREGDFQGSDDPGDAPPAREPAPPAPNEPTAQAAAAADVAPAPDAPAPNEPTPGPAGRLVTDPPAPNEATAGAPKAPHPEW